MLPIVDQLFDKAADSEEQVSVLFDDNFSAANFPWKVTTGTGVLSRTTSAGEYITGGAGLKLTTSTVNNEVCEAHLFLPKPMQRYMLFGGMFGAMDENLANCEIALGYRDGTNLYRARLIHNYSGDVFQWDAGGTGSVSLQTLVSRDMSEASTILRPHEFVFVVDLTAYTHEMIGIDEYDSRANTQTPVVKDYPMRTTADGTIRNMVDLQIITTNLPTAVASNLIFDRLYALAFNTF